MICINTIGSYKCQCEIGYYWIGGKCIDINECVKYENLCDSDRTVCVNNPGSYECNCVDGFTKSGIC